MNAVRRVETARTHYEVLGVPAAATPEAIRAAQRDLARQFHPDRCKLSNAHELMSRVNVAYSCLMDPIARRKYDLTNKIKAEHCPTCKGKGHVLKQQGFNKKVSAICPTCHGMGAA